MKIRADQVVTIAEARKLLGDDASHMSDAEVEQLIADFDVIAQYSIKLVQEFQTKENKQIIKVIK